MPPGQGALADRRGIEQSWVDGGLRVAHGQVVTCTAASGNSVNDQRFLELVERPTLPATSW